MFGRNKRYKLLARKTIEVEGGYPIVILYYEDTLFNKEAVARYFVKTEDKDIAMGVRGDGEVRLQFDSNNQPEWHSTEGRTHKREDWFGGWGFYGVYPTLEEAHEVTMRSLMRKSYKLKHRDIRTVLAKAELREFVNERGGYVA